MESQKINQGGEYEEIDLRDLVNVLIKQRKTIVFSTIFATVVAFGVSLVMPKVYRAQMAFEVGAVDGAVPVESITQVKDKIDQGIYTNLVKKAGAAVYPIKTANTAGSDIISLTVEGSDPQGAANFLTKVGELVITDHNKITASRRQVVQSQIEANRSYIESLRAEVKKPGKECSSEKYVAINGMEGRAIDIEVALAQIKDTSVVSSPTVSGAPIKPNVMMNTILGAILGLFFGIFAALFINWWKEGSSKKK